MKVSMIHQLADDPMVIHQIMSPVELYALDKTDLAENVYFFNRIHAKTKNTP